MIISVFNKEFDIKEADYKYDYQKDLTKKLDNLSGDFNKNTINEIVLWKLNRFVELSKETLALINEIPSNSKKNDEVFTRKVLKHLLAEKGVRLPMASTILRYKNPNIYQIIDQRVYRILYGKTLTLSSSKTEDNVEKQINMYMEYLSDLKKQCTSQNISFQEADRVLYMADKRLNKNESIKN